MVRRTVSAGAVPRWAGRMSRLRGRNRGSVAQIGRKHQHQRRNDAEGEKCIQRWQDAAEVAGRPAGKPPHDRACRQPADARNGARSGRDFQPRAAFRTNDVVRARRRFRRGNFRLAMRTHANSHGSPPDANAYNNRIRAPMKREDKNNDSPPFAPDRLALEMQLAITKSCAVL
jgi:hypothetical protein